jgi:hypothetical protein
VLTLLGTPAAPSVSPERKHAVATNGDGGGPAEAAQDPSPTLPAAGLRTYVLRCAGSTPFHHGNLGPLGVQHHRSSPPVTSRLYASVNKAEDSVRLALSLSEAEL